jgi:hypothetical protein
MTNTEILNLYGGTDITDVYEFLGDFKDVLSVMDGKRGFINRKIFDGRVIFQSDADFSDNPLVVKLVAD